VSEGNVHCGWRGNRTTGEFPSPSEIRQRAHTIQVTLNNLTVGRSVLEALRLLEAFQAVAKHGVLCPVDWQPSKNTTDTMKTISNTLTESYDDRLANLQQEFGNDSIATDLDATQKGDQKPEVLSRGSSSMTAASANSSASDPPRAKSDSAGEEAPPAIKTARKISLFDAPADASKEIKSPFANSPNGHPPAGFPIPRLPSPSALSPSASTSAPTTPSATSLSKEPASKKTARHTRSTSLPFSPHTSQVQRPHTSRLTPPKATPPPPASSKTKHLLLPHRLPLHPRIRRPNLNPTSLSQRAPRHHLNHGNDDEPPAAPPPRQPHLLVRAVAHTLARHAPHARRREYEPESRADAAAGDV
jgi:hypothetical protein